MNKKFLLILLVLVLGVVSYTATYHLRTEKVRSLQCNDQSELLWLKAEFHLNDTQFEKIKALHKAYVPRCEAMCDEIKEARQQLDEAINTHTSVSPEVIAALENSDRVKAQCEQATLEHIYAVSANMSPSEGKRFIKMMAKHMLLQAQAGEL